MVDEVDKDITGADEAADGENEGEVIQKKSLSTIKIVILSVLMASLLSGGLVGLTMFLVGDDSPDQVVAENETADEEEEDDEEDAAEEDEAEEEETKKASSDKQKPAQYHRLDPKFVVSFRDQKFARFMQFSLQIMTRDNEVIKQIQQHNPAVRSNLLLLFDMQEAVTMNSREGKEKLLQTITDDINASLEDLAGVSGVEATYFESFLIQ